MSYLVPVVVLLLAVLTYEQSCILEKTLDCNTSQSLCPNATSITSLPSTFYDCDVPLELSADQLFIQGTFSGLTLSGKQVTIDNLTVLADLNINAGESLGILGSTSIIGNLLVSSNISNNTLSVAASSATLTANKVIIINTANIDIQSTSITTSASLCLYQRININQISSNISILIQNNDTQALSQLNFTIFLVAADLISVNNSQLIGVATTFISQGNTSLLNSNINTTAQSCKTNSGLGRGSVIQYKNTYCTSGSSSCGYGSISNFSLCSDIIQYFLFLSHSFPYISKGPYLSTGSGGYGYNPNSNGRGAGGGIVFIFSENTFEIDSSIITASGGDSYIDDPISAGSGGTIFITARYINSTNINNISAAGGNSYNSNGSGAGGLIKISYQNATIIPEYSLWININEGFQSNEPQNQIYSNGIFYGPLCNGGSEAYYLGCKKCDRTYFSTLGDPVCRPCLISKEYLQSSTDSKSLLSQCFIEKSEESIFILLTPGDISILSISLYIGFLVILTIIGAILKKRIKKEKLSSGDQFKLDDVQRDIEKAKMIALELRKSKQIKSQELMYHVHRISCFGNNTEDSPWVLPTIVPHQVRNYVLPQVFLNFAESFNKIARWSKFQYWIVKLSIIFYPFYWYYLDKIKKQKFSKLQTMLEHAKDYNLINNYDYEDRSLVTIKFSKNKDYTNCYFDFFVYQKADTKYFTLASPFILYLSGQGSFLRPFYLQEGDIFFRLMFLVINRNFNKFSQGDEKRQLFSNMISQKKRQKNCFELARFLRKINTIACTLDMSAPRKQIALVLWKMVEFIDKWNRQFFNKMSVQIDLIVMMSQLSGKNVIDNQVQILTKKDREVFLAFILQKINEIESWEESSIKIGLVIYNPDQQVARQEEPSRVMRQENDNENEDNEESMKQSLIISSHNLVIEKKKTLKQKIFSGIGKITRLIRYFMLSHRHTRYDEYTIKFLQSLFILMQTMLVFIWSIKLQVPYVGVNIVCPFIGIIWFVSDSYGFGKLYLIMNSMSLINELVTLISYSIVQAVDDDEQDLIVKNVICSSINICIVVLMMFVGNRAITHSKKLSLKKEQEAIDPIPKE